ncbi:MAG: hypothetical protein ACOY5R_22380 [Pseudomonadota bacterium]
MSKDIYERPERASGNPGDERPDMGTGPEIRHSGRSAEDNRGRRAPVSGSGVVVGSGAGAGGAGGDEDFDSDPAGGGGAGPSPRDDHPKTGADAPISGSR